MICSSCGAQNSDGTTTCSACGVALDLSSSPTEDGGGLVSPRLELLPGARFADRYTIVERIGEGGMGQVYKARDEQLGRPVALKLVRAGTPGAKGLQRFRRELALARQVSHPNVCRVHDIGEVDGVHFISMEFVEGQTLRDWARAVGKLSTQQTVTIARQICAGLAAIHAQSIVHRDLKPSNIMLDTSGRAVIVDFGLAYQLDANQITAEGEVLGTLAYLSPEQARGDSAVDHRSDIFALGLVIFEILTGARPPADGNSLPLGLRDRTQRCRPPSVWAPDVPELLDKVVLRCLEHRRSRRFPSVQDVDQALADVEQALPSGPSRSIVEPRPKRNWVPAAAIAVALAVGAFLWTRIPSVPSGPVRIAVLPFSYEGAESTEFLANLLPVVVIKHLREVEGVEVAPYASSRSIGSDEDSASSAQHLGVDWVLSGQVSVDGDAYRATLDLWSASDADTRWSGEFSGLLSEPVAAVDGAASELLSALDRRPATGGPAGLDPAAVTTYVEGLAFLEGWDVERNIDQAIAAFTRALALEDNFPEAHAGLSRALWLRYRSSSDPALVDRAVHHANRAVELAPRLPEARLAQGVVLLGRGRTPEAAEAFEMALELAPADDAVARRIGDAYAALGRSEEAEDFYERAIALRPEFWESYNKMGVFHLDNSAFAEADHYFTRVIDLRPDSDIGYTNLAATKIYSGNLEDARPLLEAAIALNPTGDAYNNLGYVHYAAHRFEEAADQFRRGADLAPGDPYLWTGLGDARRQLGLDAEARVAYRRSVPLFEDALSINPDAAGLKTLMATALAGLGECADATGTAAEAVAGADDDLDAHYYAAVAYSICGDHDAAESHAVRALEGGYELDVRTNPDLEPLLARPAIQALLR